MNFNYLIGQQLCARHASLAFRAANAATLKDPNQTSDRES